MRSEVSQTFSNGVDSIRSDLKGVGERLEEELTIMQNQLNRAEILIEELNLSGLNKKQIKLIKKYYQDKNKYLRKGGN